MAVAAHLLDPPGRKSRQPANIGSPVAGLVGSFGSKRHPEQPPRPPRLELPGELGFLARPLQQLQGGGVLVDRRRQPRNHAQPWQRDRRDSGTSRNSEPIVGEAHVPPELGARPGTSPRLHPRQHRRPQGPPVHRPRQQSPLGLTAIVLLRAVQRPRLGRELQRFDGESTGGGGEAPESQHADALAQLHVGCAAALLGPAHPPRPPDERLHGADPLAARNSGVSIACQELPHGDDPGDGYPAAPGVPRPELQPVHRRHPTRDLRLPDQQPPPPAQPALGAGPGSNIALQACNHVLHRHPSDGRSQLQLPHGAGSRGAGVRAEALPQQQSLLRGGAAGVCGRHGVRGPPGLVPPAQLHRQHQPGVHHPAANYMHILHPVQLPQPAAAIVVSIQRRETSVQADDPVLHLSLRPCNCYIEKKALRRWWQ
ncbi:uncharacterized protein LOC9662683 isoform X2 [Selaginella moellendorffii]|uniref:uncharacterized protein LOC9662683 isoform X2 n=1 Tax=Selaginella moellendorffii TaxID=88036 RepID=UPI000D1CCE10|nr:uncharacterized protein LOC9662683 isoform X2 [Selaginella moellendorffii]|eukprot:XP_002988198.2 uncharacterized protein LOC9662683 isoform X2 [Selaginella moellendorffii]